MSILKKKKNLGTYKYIIMRFGCKVIYKNNLLPTL